MADHDKFSAPSLLMCVYSETEVPYFLRSDSAATLLLVGGSSKIQTLCHMTQVRTTKLVRFTAMERLPG